MWVELPPEIFLKIALHCDGLALSQMSQVCHQWKLEIKSHWLLRRRYFFHHIKIDPRNVAKLKTHMIPKDCTYLRRQFPLLIQKYLWHCYNVNIFELTSPTQDRFMRLFLGPRFNLDRVTILQENTGKIVVLSDFYETIENNNHVVEALYFLEMWEQACPGIFIWKWIEWSDGGCEIAVPLKIDGNHVFNPHRGNCLRIEFDTIPFLHEYPSYSAELKKLSFPNYHLRRDTITTKIKREREHVLAPFRESIKRRRI